MAVRVQFTSIQLMFLLLCSALLATTLQGVQGEVDVEGPSESECRPYIEKALKKLETGDTQSAEVQDDIAHIVTTDDSETQGDSLEITDAETSKSAEDETQDDGGKSVEETEGAESVEDTTKEEQDASAETGEPQEVSAEEKDETAEKGDSEAAEETEEVADESAEKAHSAEQQDETSVETDTQEVQSEEKGDVTDEQASVEDTTAEQEASKEVEGEPEGSIEKEESGEKDTSAEQEGSDKDVSGEQTQSAEQDAASVEQEGSQEQADEPKGEESAEEQTEESAEEKGESLEQKDESAEQKEESAEQKDSNEQKEGSVEQKESEEQKEESAEQKDESVEVKEESGEQKEDSAEQDGASVEKEEDASTEKQESVEQDGESVEKEASVEETAEKESAEKQESVEQQPSEVESDEKDDKAESEEAKVSEEASAEKEEADSKQEESAEQEQGDEAASKEEAEDNESKEAEGEESKEAESTPEEDLTWEIEIPTDLRARNHINEILHLNEETSESDNLLLKAADSTLKELKRIYENAIKPLETLYKYRDLSNRHFGDPEIFSKPLVLFMGPWSGGKSSIINYLLDNEYAQTSLRTGAEPSPAYFNLLMWGEEPEVLDGTQLAADWTFSGLQKFGQGLEERLRGLKLPNKLLEKINIVEIPGILEVRKQVSRMFPFNDACQWFIDRADIIFLIYDPSKLDVGPETEAILDQLKGREYQTRIILNKADQVKPEELMRVQGALIWNISPLMSSAQPPVMYSTSLWSKPYEYGSPSRLLLAQERAFLRDLKSAIDKRIDNKIASARRFAVRVRNHAKMVDCYLTTYYNHKSVFGNKKLVADQIIEHPQDYHIYEGLSTLTNISRYDLPDPDVYRDFFRLNPLYDFQQLSATCTYFRGCPINRLDVAIAYDLPELVGKHKKMIESITAASNTDSSTKS